MAIVGDAEKDQRGTLASKTTHMLMSRGAVEPTQAFSLFANLTESSQASQAGIQAHKKITNGLLVQELVHCMGVSS